MKNVTILLAVMAVLVWAGPANAALYETGFENPPFATDTTVAGTDGWWVAGGYGVAEDDSPISGSQSLLVGGDSQTGYEEVGVTFTNTTDLIVTTECKVRMSVTNKQSRLYVKDGGNKATQILFQTNATIMAYDGVLGYINLKNPDNSNMTYSAGTVYDVKMVTDATAGVKTYDVYIDGVLGGSGINFYKSAVTYVDAFGAATYSEDLSVDDLSIIPEPATMVLLGLGGIGVLLRRRKK